MSKDGTDCITDRWLSGRAISRTDLDRCQPSEALAQDIGLTQMTATSLGREAAAQLVAAHHPG